MYICMCLMEMLWIRLSSCYHLWELCGYYFWSAYTVARCVFTRNKYKDITGPFHLWISLSWLWMSLSPLIYWEQVFFSRVHPPPLHPHDSLTTPLPLVNSHSLNKQPWIMLVWLQWSIHPFCTSVSLFSTPTIVSSGMNPSQKPLFISEIVNVLWGHIAFVNWFTYYLILLLTAALVGTCVSLEVTGHYCMLISILSCVLCLRKNCSTTLLTWAFAVTQTNSWTPVYYLKVHTEIPYHT